MFHVYLRSIRDSMGYRNGRPQYVPVHSVREEFLNRCGFSFRSGVRPWWSRGTNHSCASWLMTSPDLEWNWRSECFKTIKKKKATLTDYNNTYENSLRNSKWILLDVKTHLSMEKSATQILYICLQSQEPYLFH